MGKHPVSPTPFYCIGILEIPIQKNIQPIPLYSPNVIIRSAWKSGDVKKSDLNKGRSIVLFSTYLSETASVRILQTVKSSKPEDTL